MDAFSLVHTILGPAKGSIQTFVLAIEITARCIFENRIAEEDLKMCGDVCAQVAKQLPDAPDKKSVMRLIERWANRCWEELLENDLAMKYIGMSIKKRGDPRKMLIYLATYAYFGKPYYQMVKEHPEMFTGQDLTLK